MGTSRRPLIVRLLLAATIAATPLLVSRLWASPTRPVSAYDRADFDKAQRELADAEDPLARYFALDRAAKTALYFGSLDEARKLAEELLEAAGPSKRDWNYGNAVHDGHEVLGLVALRRKDVETAKKELLLAGETPGSPQLDTFGPNMLLAKELLEWGEVETVVAYFDRCRRFWEMHDGRLDAWSSDAQARRAPDFGANLVF